MLDQHLIVKTRPFANEKNIVFWDNYRVTVLQDRLFRLEYNENKRFRDDATQSVWFRDMAEQDFQCVYKETEAIVQTSCVTLILRKNRKDCRIQLNGGELLKIGNTGNLKGTYRTLDRCDGFKFLEVEQKKYRKIQLGTGVCSRTGVAVIDDSHSLTLGQDGKIKAWQANGTDEYIFAYGNDYRGAVKALYLITGNTPLIPRFALGNWWSRYHAYTQDEYIRLLNRFEERKIPLTVATIDMDWHYSDEREMEDVFSISAQGKRTLEYTGSANVTWTGYTWNERLFPDYKSFLKDVQEKNLKITLNLHPADGIRFWESAYEEMAKAVGMNAEEQKYIPFNMTNETFINAYFSVLHKPYEADGVTFWWIDWQQGTNSKMEGLDPLWMLNHYHYLDNASNHSSPLILSRYAGVGSHRYPLGFSGDTMATWKTLRCLPEFTATATNIGYTWWSHDIGGHYGGEKSDEMYVRHIQYGVLSPINRLHCSSAATASKEPLYYGNGAGGIAEEWLRFRHRLIPYLYTCSHNTHAQGRALVEPLYYEWDQKEAYTYKNQYLFGEELFVIPVTTKRNADGYARIRAWLPKGKWTDIFTGDRYCIEGDGEEKVLLRTLDSIPVLIKSGGILPLSRDEGNSIENPAKFDICVWSGTGEYTLYEDGRTQGNFAEFYTEFKTVETEEKEAVIQTLEISSKGDATVIPEKRLLRVLFKDIEAEVDVSVYKNGDTVRLKKCLTDCAAAEFVFEPFAEYLITIKRRKKTRVEELIDRALECLLRGEEDSEKRFDLWGKIQLVKDEQAFCRIIDESNVSGAIKERLKETL